MANPEHLAAAKEGREAWSQWRAENPGVRPDLSDINFERELKSGEGFYDLPYLSGFDFSGSNLNRVVARNSFLENCSFDNCDINFADLCFSNFVGCTFRGTSMRVTKIGSASFEYCQFDGADLAYCTAQESDFTGSRILRSSLNHVRLVQANMSDVLLAETSVYGVSAWDLILDGAEQRDLLITDDASRITVGSIEVAQFLYLLIHNPKVREVIDTIVSKVVLILGRFSDEQKPTLDHLKKVLKNRGYIPILFDFQGPESRDLTETVSTLAHLSRFVIADLTDPSSVPHELQKIIPGLPSVPVQPLIKKGCRPYGMFEHNRRYPWVLPVQEYQSNDMEQLVESLIQACEQRLEVSSQEFPTALRDNENDGSTVEDT